MLGKLKSKI